MMKRCEKLERKFRKERGTLSGVVGQVNQQSNGSRRRGEESEAQKKEMVEKVRRNHLKPV